VLAGAGLIHDIGDVSASNLTDSVFKTMIYNAKTSDIEMSFDAFLEAHGPCTSSPAFLAIYREFEYRCLLLSIDALEDYSLSRGESVIEGVGFCFCGLLSVLLQDVDAPLSILK